MGPQVDNSRHNRRNTCGWWKEQVKSYNKTGLIGLEWEVEDQLLNTVHEGEKNRKQV